MSINADDIYFDIEDYEALFKNEIAFGKKLKIFSALGKVLLDNPESLKDWVNDSNPMYKDTAEVCEQILDIVNN